MSLFSEALGRKAKVEPGPPYRSSEPVGNCIPQRVYSTAYEHKVCAAAEKDREIIDFVTAIAKDHGINITMTQADDIHRELRKSSVFGSQDYHCALHEYFNVEWPKDERVR
jgi:hypothetical protein